MPILDMQREAARAGRIRIGRKVPAGTRPDGTVKVRPEKLDTFRFTTASRHAAAAIAREFGGEPHAWVDGPRAGEVEVITERSEIPVVIPPSRDAVSQWYELWTGAGCVRRCDGRTETKTGQPCLCPADLRDRAEAAKHGRACQTTTRVNVMIPDLPGIGVWMLESKGWHAARELGGTAEVIAATARDRGLLLPALLRIEQREVRTPGQKLKQFPVPVLEVTVSLHEILAAAEGGRPLGLPLSPSPARAIEAPQAGPQVPAQRFADEADSATTLDTWRDVWRRADAAGVLDDVVETPGSDTHEHLRDFLAAVGADLSAQPQEETT